MADEKITYIVNGKRVDPDGKPVAEPKKAAAKPAATGGDKDGDAGEKTDAGDKDA